MFRLTSLAILIERIVATYYASVYERHRYLKYTDLIASFTCVGISLTIPAFTVFLAIPDTFIILFITLSLFAIVFLTMFLVKKNQELRRLTQMNPMLHHRYQLAMNLRLLSLLQPCIIFIALINFIGVIILYIVAFTTSNFLYGYNALYYTYYTGISCITVFVTYKYYSNYQKLNKVKCIKIVTVTSNEISNVRIVTTMGGQSLPTKLSVDTYFSDLHNAWK
uniref:Gustatory receptor n=1 Tax=Panagrolaimus sp. ES5 TaxID=591445 RepID=A0AC34G020_9BILA